MFSSETAERNRELKRFLYKNLYRHYKVERMRIKAERFLTMLFENYLQHYHHDAIDKYKKFS